MVVPSRSTEALKQGLANAGSRSTWCRRRFLGPLGLVDDAGVVAAVVLLVYKLVTARRILADGGVEVGRPGRRLPHKPDRR